jgi:hypothetical protein
MSSWRPKGMEHFRLIPPHMIKVILCDLFSTRGEIKNPTADFLRNASWIRGLPRGNA